MLMRPIPLTQGGFFRPALMALFALLSVSAWAQETASLAIHEPVSGTNALRDADPSQLAKPSSPLAEEFNQAVELRINGALKESTAAAERCYQHAVSPRELASLGATCKELAAGNYFIKGDIHNWAKSALELQARVRGAYGAFAGGRTIVLENFVGIDFQSIASAFSEPVGVATPVKAVRVPRLGLNKPGFDLDKEPVLVEISINGKREAAMVDTGSSVSVINAAAASQMGLRAVTDHYVPISDPSRPSQVASKLVRVDELRIGSIKLNDVAFAVSNLPTIIGLDVLQKLAPVLISREELTFFAEPHRCENKSSYRSKWLGDFGLMSQMTIDGKTQLVHIDTGDDGSIAALKAAGLSVSAPVQSRSVAAVGGRHTINFQKTSFQLENGSINGEYRPDFDDVFAYRVGSLILKDRDIWIDTANMRACLLQRK